MKIFCLSISLVFFFITGCSSIYKVTSYNSKEEPFKKFNNHTRNRKLEITLKNDSTFVVPLGAVIKDDVLVINYNSQETKKHLPLTDIKQISYRNYGPAVPYGIGSGILAGSITGLMINLNNPGTTYGLVLIGAIAGAILGGIVGILIGWTHIYLF